MLQYYNTDPGARLVPKSSPLRQSPLYFTSMDSSISPAFGFILSFCGFQLSRTTMVDCFRAVLSTTPTQERVNTDRPRPPQLQIQ
eukprot:scaffold14885_cov114-Skeletonema_marinoi.AAC.1